MGLEELKEAALYKSISVIMFSPDLPLNTQRDCGRFYIHNNLPTLWLWLTLSLFFPLVWFSQHFKLFCNSKSGLNRINGKIRQKIDILTVD